MYHLINANNIELRNGTEKGVFRTLDEARFALNTELRLVAKEHGIDNLAYVRIIHINNNTISYDYGSWSDFIGIYSDEGIDWDEFIAHYNQDEEVSAEAAQAD